MSNRMRNLHMHLSLCSLVFACLGGIRETDMQLNMYITLYYYYRFLSLQYHKLYTNTHLSV